MGEDWAEVGFAVASHGRCMAVARYVADYTEGMVKNNLHRLPSLRNAHVTAGCPKEYPRHRLVSILPMGDRQNRDIGDHQPRISFLTSLTGLFLLAC